MRADTRTLFTTAMELAQTGDPARIQEAEQIASSLLTHRPDDPLFTALAGMVAGTRKQYGVARALLKRAIELDGSIPEFHNNLGACCRFLNLIEEGRAAYREAIRLNPDDAIYHANLAGLYVARGEAELGLPHADRAIEMQCTAPDVENNKSLLLLELGRYGEGWDIYDARLKTGPAEKVKHYGKPTPMWDGTKGQTVVVYGEQGIGDEVMFASMLPDVARDCNVIFDCHDRLASLFRASFPGVTIYGTKREDPMKLSWPARYPIDARVPVGSLGKYYRRAEADFPRAPYLKVAPEVSKRVGERVSALGSRPKIGFSWQGGGIETHRFERVIPLEMWRELWKLPVEWVSLQYDKDAGVDLTNFGAPPNVHHFADIHANPDYHETAALVGHLDLIISVPQSVIHLAGGLGKETWQLTPKRAMWQMGVYGKDMPWYECVRNFWQDDTCRWEPVMQRVHEELCRRLASSTGN